MKMCKLITTKPHKYGTRHLTAGDEYEVPMRHAFALVAGKKAKFAPDKPARSARVGQQNVHESEDSIDGPAIPAQPEHGVGAMTSDASGAKAVAEFLDYMRPNTLVGQIGGNDKPDESIENLRQQATGLGVDVDGRWGVARLQYEIAQAKR